MAWLAPLGVALLGALGPANPGPDPNPGPSARALYVKVPEDVSGPDRAALRERFEQGITRAGFDHRPAPTRANDCADAECYRAAAESSGTGLYVGATIERDGPDHTIEVYAIDGNTGEVVASVNGVCEICGMGELGDKVEALATRLRPALENNTQPTVLLVDSDPAGAEVWVDSQMVGMTPLQTDVSAGPHQVDVIKRGHRTEHVELEARPGIKESFSFRLARTTAVPGWLPWAALGTGVGALGAGIGLLAIDERQVQRNCNPDVDGACEFLYDTVNGGVVLTVVGIALVGTGVGLIINQSQKNRLQRSGVEARIRLVPGLGGASLVGRF